jgi:hypothetical protein
MNMKKLNMFLVIAVSIFVIASVSNAGNGSGKNVPSGHPFEALQQHWDQKIQCDLQACPRFELVLDGEAVLDKETGLVWEKSPSTTTRTWTQSQLSCYKTRTGDRLGWHLPTIEQLASIVDPTNIDLSLPTGHPFTNVQSGLSDIYWSATTKAGSTTSAVRVEFRFGGVDDRAKTASGYMWCVRGGQSHDAY